MAANMHEDKNFKGSDARPSAYFLFCAPVPRKAELRKQSIEQYALSFSQQLSSRREVKPMEKTKKVGQISVNLLDALYENNAKDSIVYSGTIFEGRRKVAVKRVLECITDNGEVEKLIRLSKDKQHDHVIRYFCNAIEKPYRYIALEWCHGTLKDFVKNNFERGGLTDVEVARQITSGLNHVHCCGISHLDMKPSNILITKESATENRVVISDFDVSKNIEGGKSIRTLNFSGTEGWIAPEVCLLNYQHRLSSKVDLFALGCLFYYIITKGQHPFNESQKNISLYAKKKYTLSLNEVDKSTQIGVLAEDILSQLLDRDPKHRPDAPTCLEHPVFWDCKKQQKFIEVSGDFLMQKGNDFHQRLNEDSGNVIGQIGDKWDVDDRAKKLLMQKYNTTCFPDLLRFVRDQYTHLWKTREVVPSLHTGGCEDYNLLVDIESRYPGFLLHIYHAAIPWRNEDKFKEFYPEDDSYVKAWDDPSCTKLVYDVSCECTVACELQISNVDEKSEFRGLAVDNEQRLLIADAGLHCVHFVDKEGSMNPLPDLTAFENPFDIAVDERGNIAVCDTGSNEVFVFDKEGKQLEVISEADGRKIREPNGIAFTDKSGKLVICDTKNHRVLVYSEFNFELAFGKKGRKPGQFNLPWMVGVDESDMVFVTDAANHRVQVFTIQGIFLYMVGDKGNGELQFIEPTGIIPFKDYFLVTDHKNKRVQVITKTTCQYVGTIGPQIDEHYSKLSRIWGVAQGKDDARHMTLTQGKDDARHMTLAQGKDNARHMTFYIADYGHSKSRVVKLQLTLRKTARKAALPGESDDS